MKIAKIETDVHKPQVNALVAKLGNHPLSNVEIERECKPLFKSKWLGCFMQDSPIPTRDGYGIMNTDKVGMSGIHWITFIKKGKCLYVYDSFGRMAKNLVPIFYKKMENKGFLQYDTDRSDQDQFGNKSVSCGHRCISSLMIAKDHGIKAFKSL